MTRKALDQAVEAARLQVIPAVRGCIYLVPRSEVPLVLRVAEGEYRSRTERELQRAGVREEEVTALGAQVLKALAGGPLSPDGLRKALPEGAVRSLGERGKKLGMSSPLPTALRYLEFEGGKVERTLEGGRLDSERYQWRLPAKNPFTGAKVPGDAVNRHAAVARRFFQSAGPATLRELCNWTALAQKDARASNTPLPSTTAYCSRARPSGPAPSSCTARAAWPGPRSGRSAGRRRRGDRPHRPAPWPR